MLGSFPSSRRQYVLIVADSSDYSSKTLFADLIVFQSLRFSSKPHFLYHINYNLYSLNAFDTFRNTNPTFPPFLYYAATVFQCLIPLILFFTAAIHCSSVLCPYAAESVVHATKLNRIYLLSLLVSVVLKYHRAAYTRKMLHSCK